MKKFSLATSTTILMVGLGGFSPNASAQSADAIYIVKNVNANANTAAQSIVSKINDFYSYIKTNVAYDWTEKQPNLDEITEPQNILGTQLTMTQDAAVFGLSSSPIASAIGGGGKGSLSGNDLGAALASNYAFDVLAPTQQASQTYGASPQVLMLCGNNMFNFESLMGYSTYAKQTLACNPNKGPQDVSQYAGQYISYVSDLGTQINNYDINAAVSSGAISSANATTVQGSPEWISFTLARRNLLAVQNAALSNLNYLYNQRAPDANGNSPESVANYVANWRTQNVNGWYDNMSTKVDLPILMRETLFVLVEIERDLHELRKENQRVLAANSILLGQGLNLGKNLLNMRFTALQKKILDVTNGTSSTSLPSSVTGGSTNINNPTTSSALQNYQNQLNSSNSSSSSSSSSSTSSSGNSLSSQTQSAIDAANKAAGLGTSSTSGTTKP